MTQNENIISLPELLLRLPAQLKILAKTINQHRVFPVGKYRMSLAELTHETGIKYPGIILESDLQVPCMFESIAITIMNGYWVVAGMKNDQTSMSWSRSIDGVIEEQIVELIAGILAIKKPS